MDVSKDHSGKAHGADSAGLVQQSPHVPCEWWRPRQPEDPRRLRCAMAQAVGRGRCSWGSCALSGTDSEIYRKLRWEGISPFSRGSQAQPHGSVYHLKFRNLKASGSLSFQHGRNSLLVTNSLIPRIQLWQHNWTWGAHL